MSEPCLPPPVLSPPCPLRAAQPLFMSLSEGAQRDLHPGSPPPSWGSRKEPEACGFLKAQELGGPAPSPLHSPGSFREEWTGGPPPEGRQELGVFCTPHCQGQLSGLCSCWPQTQAAGWRRAQLTSRHTPRTQAGNSRNDWRPGYCSRVDRSIFAPQVWGSVPPGWRESN